MKKSTKILLGVGVVVAVFVTYYIVAGKRARADVTAGGVRKPGLGTTPEGEVEFGPWVAIDGTVYPFSSQGGPK
jgi:hypothetical protein